MDVNVADITYASIAAECWFFFFAGFEASALVVSKALFELSRNSDVQEKLRKEVDAVVEKYNGEITYEAFEEMTYMDMIINGKLHVLVGALLISPSFSYIIIYLFKIRIA